MNAKDETSMQLLFLHHLRQFLPDEKVITYTFPADSFNNQEINFPFRDILRYGHNYVNAFNVSYT